MWLMIIGVRGVNDAYMLANAEAKRKFKGQQIARGHMNPSAINSFDTSFMKATFTFTMLYLSLRNQTADLGSNLRKR